MVKVIGVLIALILTDFFIFPFEPAFLPGTNVKTVMAGLSLPYVFFLLAKKGGSVINSDIITIFLSSLPITLFSWVSNVYNNTYDYSFNTYFVSIFVWMGAAFMVVSLINAVHQNLSVQLVANYLIGVCVLQCALSQYMVYNPVAMNFVHGLMAEGGEAYMGDAGDRIHGLGCALDVAGGRFAAVLLMAAYFLTQAKTKWELFFYVISFFIIAILGNMIGRTTTVGIVLSILYWGYDMLKGKLAEKIYLKYMATIFIIIIPIVVFLYNTNNVFYTNVRFGFEGFFALAEQGKWVSNSTNVLTENMIVFPDNLKTWIIGDGYGANPYFDPYYTGKGFHGFYMGTDIGYLRFIFFFGVLGMFSMILLFVCFWHICRMRFPMQKDLISLLLILNLIIWFKVTSDLLPIFAILLCISKEDNDRYMLQAE